LRKVLVFTLALMLFCGIFAVGYANVLENNVIEEEFLPLEAQDILEQSIGKLDSVESVEVPVDDKIDEQTVIQYGAVIGQKVRWKKKVVLKDRDDNFTVEVPKEANEIKIINEEEKALKKAKIDGQELAESDKFAEIVDFYESSFGGFITFLFSVQLNDDLLIEPVVVPVGDLLGEVANDTGDVVDNETEGNETSGNETETIGNETGSVEEVIGNETVGNETEPLEEESEVEEEPIESVTNETEEIEEVEEEIETSEIVIEEEVDSVEIEYETPAPQAREIDTNNGKTVLVYSDVHYENVLTFVEIDNTPAENIKLYWQENSEGELVDVTSDESVNLQMYDTDEDELVDYLEWITPHTSNQTFEISLTVLNPYSYLRDGEDWVVAFNTTGVGDLLISSTNANWTEIDTDDVNTSDAMEFLNISCGSIDLKNNLTIVDFSDSEYNYTNLTNTSVKPAQFLVENYSCNDTGYFSNYMHDAGYATLQLNFSNQTHTITDYAYDPSGDICNANATGYWTDASNWENCDDTYPLGSDIGAIINSSYTITINDNITIQNITVNGTLDTSKYDFNVTEDVTINGILDAGDDLVGFDFDGAANYINLSSEGDYGTSNSVSFWYHYPSQGVSATQYFMGSELSPGFGFRYNGATLLAYYGAAGDSDSYTVSLINNTEYLITLVRVNDTTVDLYLNDTKVDTLTNANWASDSTLIKYIGKRQEGYYIDGSIHNIRVYNYTLTDSHVSQLYANTYTNTTGLVGWWKLDERTGSTATDSGSGGNGGTIYGDSNWITNNDQFGSLAIYSGGTFNATIGNTTVGGEMYRSGTFNHNDGTVVRQQSSGDWDGFSSASSAFYNLINEGGYTADGNTLWIINSLYTPAAGSFNLYYNGNLILGNDTQSGSVSGDGVSDFTLNLKYPNTVRGANAAYPAQIIKHYMGGNSAGTGYLTLNNTEFSLDLTTGGNTNTGGIKIYGNSTFRDLNINSPNKVYAYNDTLIESLDIDDGATFIAPSGTLTLYGENPSGYALDNDGTFTASSGLVNFTDTGNTVSVDLVGTGNVYDVEIASGDLVAIQDVDTVIDNDVTITSGTFRSGSGDYINLTVTGDVSVSGTFGDGGTSMFGSSVLLGSLTINSGGIYNATNGTTYITSRSASLDGIDAKTGSTFTHNNGTVNMTGSPGVRFLDMQAGDSFYNFIQDSASKTSANYAIACDNDLTVAQGELELKSTGTVTGDVAVSGTLDGADASFAMTFDSLTIQSGGTYNATSGTTTLTGSNPSAYTLDTDSGSTFTHNSGILLMQDVGTPRLFEMDGTGSLYNFVFNSSGTSMQWNSPITVSNDLTITSGSLVDNSITDAITVTGDVSVSGTFGRTAQSGAYSFGSLTINSGGTFVGTSGNTTVSGNLINYGTFIDNVGTVVLNNNATIVGFQTDDFKNIIIGQGSYIAHKDNLTTSGTVTINGTLDSNSAGGIILDGDEDYIAAGDLGDVSAASFWFYTANALDASSSTQSPLFLGNDSTTSYEMLNLGSSTGLLTDEMIAVIIKRGATQYRSGYCSATDNISVGWHNVVITHGGTYYDIYLDGVQVDNCYDGGTHPTIDANNVRIGVSREAVSYFNGTLSDIRLYNITLSGDNIAGLYNQTYNNITGLKAWFKLNDGSGSSVSDSAESNTGTLYGNPVWFNPDVDFGGLSISSGSNYDATFGITTITGNLTNSGTFTNNSGTVVFSGSDSYLAGATVFDNVTISGNLTLVSDANYTNITVTSTGNLTYNTSHYDNGMVYYKYPGGYVGLTGGATLTSNASWFNGTTNDDRVISSIPSSNVWVDSVAAGSTWALTGWDGTAPIIVLNLPADMVNTTSQNITFNFTTIENYPGTVNCSLYIDNVYVSGNATTANNTLTSLDATDIAEGNHSWNVTCLDGASNSNTSVMRIFTIDITGPTVTNFTYTKVGGSNSTDDVDPNVNVLFNVSVSDSAFSVDRVVLEYHNGTNWTNSTMTNTSASYYNTTVSMMSTEANYTYRILANDTLNNINQTSNQTFESAWDCTWSAITDLETDTGWDENAAVGNITINNTGDANYSVASCSLDFRLTYNLTEGRIYYKMGIDDWEYVKNLGYYTIPANSSGTIQTNATFLSEVSEDSYLITLDEFRTRSDTRYGNVTGSIIANQQGPYILQQIASPTSGSTYYLTDQNITLQGRVRNIMGVIPENTTNTAHNVTSNWTLASGFTTSNDSSLNYTNISNSSWHNNYINITFSNLATSTAGTKTFYLLGSGYNSSGGLILNADNETLFNTTVNMTFLCYNTSDDVCVASCGYTQDPDCDEPTPGSNSPGGGGTLRPRVVQIHEVFNLIRGKNQSYMMNITNKLNSTADINITVKGFNSDYIRVQPSEFTLKPFETKIFTTYIEAPSYFTRGQHNLTYSISIKNKKYGGVKTTKDIRIVTLNIYEVSADEALIQLNESIQILNELEAANFSVNGIKDLIDEAENKLLESKYLEVHEINERIKQLKEIIFEVDESIRDIDGKIENADYWGLDVPKTERLTNLAKAALSRGDFELAKSRIEEAQILSSLETKGEINLPYFVYRNLGLVIASIIILTIISIIVYLRIRIYLIRRDLENLGNEQNIVLGLIKQVQKECFVDKKLSMNEYMQAVMQYEARLSKNIEHIIKLETERSHLFGLDEIKKLHEELQKLVELLKNTQRQYLEAGKIQTSMYNQKMKFLTKRITEVEEKITVLEARREIEERTNPILLMLGHNKFLAKHNIVRIGRGAKLW